MNKRIAVIPGDGIGPQITDSAVAVLKAVGKKFGHNFEFVSVEMGGKAIDRTGDPLPRESVDICLAADSVLLGAVGGPKWEGLSAKQRPESGLLGIRKALKLYANLRPVRLFCEVSDRSPLRTDIVKKGVDLIIVRELTGGIYFGERGTRQGRLGKEAYDTECYSETEIERIARIAFEFARKRKRKLTSIDKANVLESSRLWRSVVRNVSDDYPDVEVENMLVDNAAMQLVRAPSQFDVILTSNMFGDILSDLAGMLSGSIGLLPSASLNDTTLGLYEPVHGSAPNLKYDEANPIGTILSAAMMLRYSFAAETEAECVENAVAAVLERGCRTADLAKPGEKICTTTEITERIADEISGR